MATVGQEQPPLVAGLRGFQYRGEVKPLLLGLGCLRRRPRHLEPCLGGQPFDRFHEDGALGLHHEADRVAMRATAEAVVVAVLIHMEAGRLFAVERAAAFPLPPGASEPHAPPDDSRQRRPGAEFVEEAPGECHQADSLAFTIGPALDISNVVACFARNVAITLPMSLMLAAPVSAIAASTASAIAASSICFGRKVSMIAISASSLSTRSCRCPWRYSSTDSRRDFTMPRSMPMISSSGTCSMPFGRAAMSRSFSRARIMRRVEVRGASLAFIDPLSWSVNCSR